MSTSGEDTPSERPSGLIYHYTTQSGLLGIINSGEIWATHFRHLNDLQEFVYAMDPLRRRVEELADGRWSEEEITRAMKAIQIENDAVKRVDLENDLNLFVASFSEVPDSLPQWRAYAHSEAGYSLGFDASEVATVLPPYLRLVRCIYDESEQRTRVEDATRKIRNDDLFTPAAAIQLLLRYLPFALTLKHPSFKDEKEWRIVSQDIPDDPKMFTLPLLADPPAQIDFRQSKSGVIPYRRVALWDKDKKRPCPLREIVVGPCPDPDRSCRSVRSLLMSRLGDWTLSSIAVRASEIPYRN